MKKKHRPSLVLGWLAFLSGDLLTLLALYLSKGTCPIPEVVTPLLSTASLTAAAPASYALGIFLVIEGFLIILTRRKKRATMFFSVPYLALCYLTLYAYYHLDPANPVQFTYLEGFPAEKRALIFVLFILELFLYIAVLIAVRPVDLKLVKRAERKQRRLEQKEVEKQEKARREERLLEQELAKRRADFEIEKERRAEEELRKQLEAEPEPEPEPEPEIEEEEPEPEPVMEPEDAAEPEQAAPMPEPEAPSEPERKPERTAEAETLSKKEEARRLKQVKKEQLRLMKENEKAEKAERERQKKAEKKPKRDLALQAPGEEDLPKPALKHVKTDPRANYEYSSSVPADPYKPIQFPVVPEIPKFATIRPDAVGPATGAYTPEQLEDDQGPSLDQIKPEPVPEPKKEARRYSLSGQTSFSRGGIVEATLESAAKAQAEPKPAVNRRPIIGFEPKKPKEVPEKPVAPSGLSPDHPRYKLFESLKEQPGVSHFPAKSFKAENTARKDSYSSVYVKEMLRDIEEHKQEAPEPAPKPSSPKRQDITEAALKAKRRPLPEPETIAIEPEVPETALTDSDFLLSVGVGGLKSNMSGFAGIKKRSERRYKVPSGSFLMDYPSVSTDIDAETRERGQIIIDTLASFNTEITLLDIIKGPTITRYEYALKEGTPINKFTSRSSEISYYLGGEQIRILAPIAGKQAVGVEVPNPDKATIGFKDMLEEYYANPAFQKLRLPMILGRTITGEPRIIDIAKMPHLLIAGTTGSGKSVCINSLLCTLLYTRSPQDVRLMLVDPKVVEMGLYNGIPHLLTEVITDTTKTVKALNWLVDEMERRYKMLARFNVRNIEGLNDKIRSEKIPAERLPYIVLVMDEFADLMTVARNDIENAVSRLAAKARAAGIHLVLATQRPSADVITGTLKNNIPGRIAFAVSSAVNSRIILDEGGAESLLGRGDMLYQDPGVMGLSRIQGAFLSDKEVEAITHFEKVNNETDYLKDDLFEDPEETEGDEDNESPPDEDSDEALYERAKEICYERKMASASYLQRRMKIGYNRAARLIEMMEDDGIVGPPQGSKPREIINYK